MQFVQPGFVVPYRFSERIAGPLIWVRVIVYLLLRRTIRPGTKPAPEHPPHVLTEVPPSRMLELHQQTLMKETDRTDVQLYAKVFKALADPTRLAILLQLKKDEDCANVVQKALGLTQSGLSYHMKILADAGLVHCRTEGQRTYYSIDRAGLRRAEELLQILG